MARIDYLDDPNARAANSMVPSVSVVVTNNDGQILMTCRTDNDNWALPGGAINLGESLTDAADRETKGRDRHRRRDHRVGRHLHQPTHVSSTPATVKSVRSSLSSSRPDPQAAHQPQQRVLPGGLDRSDKVPDLRMHPSMRQRVGHYLKQLNEPYLG